MLSLNVSAFPTYLQTNKFLQKLKDMEEESDDED